jgi:hypothetical protein
MLQSSLPTVVFDTGFTDRQSEHLPLGNPKEARGSNAESRFSLRRLVWDSDFGIPSAFGDSDFGLKLVAGVGVAPTEAEFMRLA